MHYLFALILTLGCLACASSQSTTTVPEPARTEQPRSRTPRDRDPQALAQRQTERMQRELNLTEAQTEQVSAINLRYAERAQQLRGQSNGDRRATFEAARELQTQRNAEFKTILSAEQYIRLEEMQAEDRQRRRAEMQERRGRRGGAGRRGGFN